MTSEWTEVPLSEIALDQGHSFAMGPFGSNIRAENYQESGVPVIRGTNLGKPGEPRFSSEEYVYLSESKADELASSTAYPDDIVFVAQGTVGKTGIIPRDTGVHRFVLSQNLMKVSIDPDRANPLYVFYYFRSSLGQHEILSRVNPTGVPCISKPLSSLREFKIRLPSEVIEQEAIACILGSLDDKIELNRRMNETLEGMARAVFKSWFVDFDPVRAKAAGRRPPGLTPRLAAIFPDSFQDSELGEIPKGWRAGTLSELSGFVVGGDWGKDQASDEYPSGAFCIRGADIPSLQSSGVGNMPVRFLKRSSIEKRSLTNGDLVIEISGGSPTQSTGRPVLITEELLDRLSLPLTCSNFCRLFRPASKVYSKYLYLLLRLLYDADIFLQYENGTTGIKNFAFSNFSESHGLLIPPEPIATTFDEKMQPLFVRMQQLGIESSVLAELRDTLLPKLISGELRVPDAEGIVGRCSQ